MASDDLEVVISRLEDAFEAWMKMVNDRLGGFITKAKCQNFFGGFLNLLHESDYDVRITHLQQLFLDNYRFPRPFFESAFSSLPAFYQAHAELIVEGHLLAISENRPSPRGAVGPADAGR